MYVPEHWYELIRTARRTNPFKVCVMERPDFISLAEIKKSIVNRKVTINREKVEWLKIRWIRVTKDNQLQFQFRYTHNTLEGWKTVDLKRKGKGRPPVIANIPLPELYSGGRAINQKKMDDLSSLLQFVPPVHHRFYTMLRSEDGTMSGDSENED